MTKQTTDKQTTDKQVLQTDWEEPVCFDSYSLPHFPVGIFPEWLRQYILNVTDVSQTPADASSMTALSVLSAALAKKFRIKPYSEGAWVEWNNLYTATIMGSGERKSTVHSRFIAPLIQYERSLQVDEPNQAEEN